MKKSPVVKTVRKGALTIEIRKYADGRFGFDYKPTDDERVKVRLHEQKDAEVRAMELLGAGAAGRADLLAIHPDEIAEFLRWRATQRQTYPIPEIAAQFLAEKLERQEKKELSEKHVSDLKWTIDAFAKKFTCSIERLDREEVEKWMKSLDVGPRRWNNVLSHIIALIRYARSYTKIGPEQTTIERIEKRKVMTKKETYSPDELEKLLRTVPVEWRPAIVLGGFCGVRPEELCPDAKSHKLPLQWGHFLWAKKKIDIPAEVAKDGRRRFVPLCDAALAWLRPWMKSLGHVVPRQKMSNMTARWAAKAGITWKYDALRHSYASYRLAIINDIPQLTLEMGNSAKMIHDHYLDLKHEDEANAWFAITPEKLGMETMPENVVSFG